MFLYEEKLNSHILDIHTRHQNIISRSQSQWIKTTPKNNRTFLVKY